MINRQWRLARRPEGRVGPEHFQWTSAPVPEPAEGQFLVRTRYLSFDPAQRGWLNDLPSYIRPVAIGEVMRALGVGEVVASRHPDFPVGCWVAGPLGWQDYALLDASPGPFPVERLEPGVPPTWYLHLLGITGLTAYFGMVEVGRLRPGETVAVSAAAGATGSVAGQLARILGCRVIGIAGGERKVRFLRDELGFDEALDHRGGDLARRLKALAPSGIELFLDNVGGEVLDSALVNLARGARVVICGAIASGYTAKEPAAGVHQHLQLVLRRARMEGFLVLDYVERFAVARAALRRFAERGQLRVVEDVAHGLEHCPEVLAGLFEGRNLGKQLLEV